MKKLIRNFCIIAHIDHGKSTLSDRIIEITGGLSKREMKDQVLDNMELERERGITIKLNAVRLNYKYDNLDYEFNLIDTPGHVDFTYEVSRSLAACEGAILLVDATKGIQAQTISNAYLALEGGLEILFAINKVDLPTSNVKMCVEMMQKQFGIKENEIHLISAKSGFGVVELLNDVIKKIPAPYINNDEPLRALVFDSFYDKYRGVICFIRVKNGSIKTGQKIKFMQTNATYIVNEIGYNTPKPIIVNELQCGEVGWISAQIKNIKDIDVGDTITSIPNSAIEPLPGYRKVLPMVYCGLYPLDTNKFEDLKEAMLKISLSDSSLVYEPETSQALGYGMRCGFLGLLHMDIIKERITREFKIELISTAPSVLYDVQLTNDEIIKVDNPSTLPDRNYIKNIKEPYVRLSITTPEEYMGDLNKLCKEKRGEYINMEFMDNNRYKINYEIPMAEIMYSFFDRLKSISKGYAVMDYEPLEYRENDLVKLDFLIANEKVDALATIVYRKNAYDLGRKLCLKLKEEIPKHQFEVAIQAAIGGKIVARETISAMRKNVLAKCYGGDVSRKKKLLEQQKEGKKRLKSFGKVSIPQNTFIKIFNED